MARATVTKASLPPSSGPPPPPPRQRARMAATGRSTITRRRTIKKATPGRQLGRGGLAAAGAGGNSQALWGRDRVGQGVLEGGREGKAFFDLC